MKPLLSKRIRLFALAAGLIAAAAAGSLALRSGDDDVGHTLDLVPNARWPVRWKNSETVVFQTSVGFATARLDGTVQYREDPRVLPRGESSYRPEPKSVRLRPDARFGSWRAWDGGRYLIRNEEKCGPPLVPSPDGRFIACEHAIHHPMEEIAEGFGAVIRIR